MIMMQMEKENSLIQKMISTLQRWRPLTFNLFAMILFDLFLGLPL